jgi:hypothetical protein
MAALVICLVIAFLPQITGFVHGLFPTGDPIVTSQLIKSKMEDVGKLSVAEYTDSHTLDARKSAIFFDAQRVTFPYDYKVALGIDLKQVSVSYHDNQMLFQLPAVEILYDEITVTGEIEKWDFFYRFTEKEYKKLLEDEKTKCKQAYLDNDELMTITFNQTVDAMKSLFAAWLKDGNATFGNMEIVFQSRPK